MNDEAPFAFFYDAGSCSLAVRIILEEGDFAYAAHQVTARDGDRDTGRAAWLARNPKGRVPALAFVPGRAGGEDGLLTEVPAILCYLAALRPELELVPADPAGAARTLEWLNWLSGWMHAVCFAQLWRPERFSDDPETFDAVRRKGRENLHEAFASVEQVFADGRKWAVPDRFTVADAFLIVFHRWGSLAGVEMSRYQAWRSFYRRALTKPAIRRAFEKDGLTLQA